MGIRIVSGITLLLAATGARDAIPEREGDSIEDVEQHQYGIEAAEPHQDGTQTAKSRQSGNEVTEQSQDERVPAGQQTSILQCSKLCYYPNPETHWVTRLTQMLNIKYKVFEQNLCYYDKYKALSVLGGSLFSDFRNSEVYSLLNDNPEDVFNFCNKVCRPGAIGEHCEDPAPTKLSEDVAAEVETKDLASLDEFLGSTSASRQPQDAEESFRKLSSEVSGKEIKDLWGDVIGNSAEDELVEVNNTLPADADMKERQTSEANLEERLVESGVTEKVVKEMAAEIRDIIGKCRNEKNVDLCCMNYCVHSKILQNHTSVSAVCVRDCVKGSTKKVPQ